jgi:two-component system sensor histidine kinase CiaH
MQKMFQSATLKLTAWYLAILLTISITFSIVIYQLNYREISFRLENLQHSLLDNSIYMIPNVDDDTTLMGDGPNSALSIQSRQAAGQMILSLIYINVVILMAGGLGSYFLARRTLRPIEESHEAQSRFTSDASHELRTPLAAMKAELEVSLRDPHLSEAESRELLESNLEEVNKLIQLSQMLLQLSRLEQDKLERGPVDVVEVLNEKKKLYKNESKRFDIISRKKAVASANEPAISELVGILIDNALKYSPKDSKISIRIFEKLGRVVFEIHNSGEPIPEEKLPKLFDRFFRADTSRTNSSQNGYGLGLSIAKKIIDVHHGDLTVSSSENGTIFTFYLPILRNNQTALTDGKITTK